MDEGGGRVPSEEEEGAGGDVHKFHVLSLNMFLTVCICILIEHVLGSVRMHSH